jgi:hypothetical protein
VKRNLLLFGCLALIGCQSRPVQELALADVAIKAAQKSKADALAPDAYRKAENHYLRAKKDYADGYYDSAKEYAKKARILAEQAEYKALVKQSQVKSPADDGGGGGGDQPPTDSPPSPDPAAPE